MNNILVMLSGGIDSTWVLQYYLKNSKYPIYIHHIMLRSDKERRFRQELKATNNIYNLLNDRYPGRLKYLSISNWWIDDRHNQATRDIDLALFVGANIAKALPGNTAIATGRNLEDDGVNLRVAANRIWKVMAETYPGLVYETLKPGSEYPKKYIIEDLPKELLDLTWSCRGSHTDKECGCCHSCLANSNAGYRRT